MLETQSKNIHLYADAPEALALPRMFMKVLCSGNTCTGKSNALFIRETTQVSHDFPDKSRK